jgi:hypothetical protein
MGAWTKVVLLFALSAATQKKRGRSQDLPLETNASSAAYGHVGPLTRVVIPHSPEGVRPLR